VVEADLTLGASLTMIDRHHSHLAGERGEHAIQVFDELNLPRWTFVDARWTLCSEHIAELDNETTC
jgi:hypothetical protein